MSESQKLTVLGIGAHPSDAFPGIGGTLAKHARRGDNVILLSVTYGIHVHTERLRDKNVEEIKDIVREESTEAAKILGVNGLPVFRFRRFAPRYDQGNAHRGRQGYSRHSTGYCH